MIILLLTLLLILELYTINRIWKTIQFDTDKKAIHTTLCLILPVIWNIIMLSIINNETDGLIVKTKGGRKCKKGTDGNSLSDYSNTGISGNE